MEHEIWPTPEFVTSLGLRKDEGAILGLTQSVALWDFDDKFVTLATPEPDLPGNRLNEGCVAPDGSFWIGTMATNLTSAGEPKEQGPKAGRYYRIAGDGNVRRLSEDLYGIPNGMIWLNSSQFVTADTTENKLFRYTITADGSAIIHRTTIGVPFGRGLPDGSCIDACGGIWTCRVGGGACLTRMFPDGTLDQVVELPCSWPTSCTFGGENLDVLFVTSARFTMTTTHLGDNPHEGGLFALRPGLCGQPQNRFTLS